MQVEFLFFLFGHAGQHAVKDVVVSLAGILRHDARFLQQVLLDIGAFDGAALVETDVDVLAEPGRVVVPHSFRISKRWKGKTTINEREVI